MRRNIFFRIINDATIGPRIIKIWTLIIIIYTLYKAYIIGWTDKMIPTEFVDFNSWAARIGYVNKGLYSLLHLNILSIIMATSIIVLPIIFYIFLFRIKKMWNNSIIIYLSYMVLFVISIYTFIRIDTPNNYYASRYFLPILVPSMILLFVIITSKMKSGVMILASILIIITFNLKYDYILFKQPVFQDRYKLIETISNNIHHSSYVFLNTDTYSSRLLIPNLNKISDLDVISLTMEENINFLEIESLLKEYAKHLSLKDIYYLTTNPISGNDNFDLIQFNNKIHPWSILYPTYINESDYNYYLYHLRYDFVDEVIKFYEMGNIDKSITSNMYDEGIGKPMWTKVESDIKLNYINEGQDVRITIQLWGYRPVDNPANVTVLINNYEIDSFVKDNSEGLRREIIVPNSLLNSDTVQTLTFKTNTFKPSNYGFEDTRELGVLVEWINIEEIS